MKHPDGYIFLKGCHIKVKEPRIIKIEHLEGKSIFYRRGPFGNREPRCSTANWMWNRNSSSVLVKLPKNNWEEWVKKLKEGINSPEVVYSGFDRNGR